MKRIEFTCDGCDSVEFIDCASLSSLDVMLDGWVTHRILAHENGAAAYEILSDLCPKCSENLRRAINPANWPRIKAMTRGVEAPRGARVDPLDLTTRRAATNFS